MRKMTRPTGACRAPTQFDADYRKELGGDRKGERLASRTAGPQIALPKKFLRLANEVQEFVTNSQRTISQTSTRPDQFSASFSKRMREDYQESSGRSQPPRHGRPCNRNGYRRHQDTRLLRTISVRFALPRARISLARCIQSRTQRIPTVLEASTC